MSFSRRTYAREVLSCHRCCRNVGLALIRLFRWLCSCSRRSRRGGGRLARKSVNTSFGSSTCIQINCYTFPELMAQIRGCTLASCCRRLLLHRIRIPCMSSTFGGDRQQVKCIFIRFNWTPTHDAYNHVLGSRGLTSIRLREEDFRRHRNERHFCYFWIICIHSCVISGTEGW